MILTSKEIKEAESNSNQSEYELIQVAGKNLFYAMTEDLEETDKILILAGSGNNGADGMVLCQYLCKNHYDVHIAFPYLNPKSDQAKKIYTEFEYPVLSNEELDEALKNTTVIVDALFGFSFHDELPDEIKKLFTKIQTLNLKVFSIDINSGAESDTGKYDSCTLHTNITYALGFYKPVHALNKELKLSNKIKLVPLPIHPNVNTYKEMNEALFFENYPKQETNEYKGTYGKALLIGGSYGMAGAVGFNIIGARSMGASYIEVGLPDEIYPILAGKFLYPVYLPFNDYNYLDKLTSAIEQAKVITFGSGATNMPHKQAILNLIIEKANCPIIFDAEAIQLLKENLFILKYAKKEVILTPHIGEFSAVSHLSMEEIKNNRIETVTNFAKENHCFVILKGANTIITSPQKDLYINESGNPVLATAGSGDLLTGILAGTLLKQKDIFTSLCMGVYMHGNLADIYSKSHSKINIDLEEYIHLADILFQKYGF